MRGGPQREIDAAIALAQAVERVTCGAESVKLRARVARVRLIDESGRIDHPTLGLNVRPEPFAQPRSLLRDCATLLR